MTTNEKRRRELAQQKAHRQQQRRETAQRRRRRRTQVVVAAVVGALVLTTVVGVVASLRSGSASSPQAATPTQQAGSCTYVDDPGDPATTTDVGRPPADPGDLGRATAVLTLNGEPVTMELDATAAPCTVGSWDFLAAADFFDDTVCHRLTTSPTLGVLQCGDPSGTGTGGPGYRFAEENLDGATYPAGTVAMANTGLPASTGSQFFVVHADSELPPQYTVVGRVTDGLEVVTAIASAGTVEGGSDGAPAAGAQVDDLVVERSES
jgi:peptidyl-prolyl cis-trans isomerase B (cyclophilin B)